ncbi:MAG: hypothetical protein ACK6EB_32140, partial [Planctomyces sp.]
GVDDSGQEVARGGNVWAVNGIEIMAGGTISQSPLSALEVDATAWGARSATIPSQLTLNAGSDLQLFGLVRSLDAGSDLQLTAGGQVLIDGLVTAPDQVTITGGTNASGYGIIVMPSVLDPITEERVSGGEVRTSADGVLVLQATGGILLQGLVGSAQTNESGTLADALTVSITSTSGPVTIENRV